MAVKKGMTSLEKDIYSVVGSVGLLAGNVALGGFIPFTIPIVLTSITGGMLLDNILNNKWDKIFQKLSICNGDGIYPKLLHEFKDKNETETKYIFKMPDKLTAYDLMKCQDALESNIHKPMQIKATKNFYAEVTVFEKASLNYIWYQIFKKCGFKNKEGEYPTFLKAEETQIGLKYLFRLPIGLCIEMFESAKPLIESAIHKPLKLNLTKDNLMAIQEFQVNFSDFYLPKYSLKHNTKNTDRVVHIDLSKDTHCVNRDLVFPIGVNLTENGLQIVYIDLTDEPHILVAGTNGSGKSNFIKCLLTSAILRDIEIRILDLKFGADYSIFENYKNLKTYTIDLNVARQEIIKIKNLMDERYHELNQTKCRNYIVYNNRFKDNQMKPIIVVIEEYYMLNTKKNKIVDELNQILSKSRACNIKFILALQRPCKDNLDPILKANLNHAVGFRSVSTYNSGIVLGEGDGRLFTELHNKGEAIHIGINNQDGVHFKSFFLEDDEESNEAYYKKYGVKFDITIKDIIAHKNKPVQTEKPIETKPTKEEKSIPTKTITMEEVKQKSKKVNLFAK